MVLLGSSVSAQQEHPTEAPGKLEIAKHPLVLEPPAGPQTQKLDPNKLRAEANELAKLSQSIAADVDQAAQGKLPKDIAEKLKRIERLSKHLRAELVP
jgi:hypothetical protein